MKVQHDPKSVNPRKNEKNTDAFKDESRRGPEDKRDLKSGDPNRKSCAFCCKAVAHHPITQFHDGLRCRNAISR